ncbi:bacteriohemerythrin [bacterium]|nr:bacteriohemerythrin [bacterium]
MSLIKWSDEFIIGDSHIDAQHQRLVDIVNKFDEAMRKGRGSRVMNEILNELIGYTQEHFADEERLLATADYPGLKAHQAQHRQLLQKIERFQFEFSEGRRVSSEVQEFLKYWLTSHILRDDKAYVASLTTTGNGS